MVALSVAGGWPCVYIDKRRRLRECSGPAAMLCKQVQVYCAQNAVHTSADVSHSCGAVKVHENRNYSSHLSSITIHRIVRFSAPCVFVFFGAV